MIKRYYALFKRAAETIEIEFPDLVGCVTFGSSWEEALENAEDVLAAWLANAEDKFIKEPSKYHELKHLVGELVLIAID